MTKTPVTDCDMERLVRRPGETMGYETEDNWDVWHDEDCFGVLTEGISISSLGRTELVMIPKGLYSSLCEP